MHGITCEYDAGATMRFDGHSQDCYQSNGGHTNVCRINIGTVRKTTFKLVIDSHHSTWNWWGNCKLVTSGCGDDSGGGGGTCSTSIDDANIQVINGGTPNSSGNCHGGHCGESSNAADVFHGKRVMFGHPRNYDVQYQICYPQPVKMTGIVSEYDAGATVCFDGTCKSCYESNGGNTNKCDISFSEKLATCYTLSIDSHHSTWNWMGNFLPKVSC